MPGWLHGGRLSWDGDSVVARLAAPHATMPPGLLHHAQGATRFASLQP